MADELKKCDGTQCHFHLLSPCRAPTPVEAGKLTEALRRVHTLPWATAQDTPHYKSVALPHAVWLDFLRQVDDALSTPAPASEVEAARCNESCTYKTSQEKPGSYICKKHKAEAIEAALNTLMTIACAGEDGAQAKRMAQDAVSCLTAMRPEAATKEG